MNISRRSFLKLAALSTAAVAVSASLTGCATPWTPNLTIVYQEEKTGESYAFTGTEANVKAGGKMWENGKKTAQSKEQFFLDLLKDLKNWSKDDEVAKKIADELAKDYTMTGKKVTVTDAKSDGSATAHTIAFIFKVENA